jgi:hypothetical protein
MNPNGASLFWNAKPFPHIIIDDFMPYYNVKDFQLALEYQKDDKPHTSFMTSIEKNKQTFNKDSHLGYELEPVVKKITSYDFRYCLMRMLSPVSFDIIPLTYINNDKTDYKYFHQMDQGGILGSHVDHSQIYDKNGIVDDRIHFLNCIYYVNDVTKGGATALYDKSGLGRPLKLVEAKANRLLIFLHTSQSFHGVTEIEQLGKFKRTTVYMDYYIDKKDLNKVRPLAKLKGVDFNFWKHKTTFVPKDMRPSYWQQYIYWMMRRPL